MIQRIILIALTIVFLPLSNCFAFWVWTPETNEWTNPKYSVKETPADQLKYAEDFFKARSYKEAIRELEKLIKHYPKAKEAPQAQFYIGASLEAQDKLYDAFKAYQVVIDKYPFSNLSSEIVQKQYDIGVEILDGKDKRNKIIDKLSGADYDLIDIFRTVIKNAPYGKLASSAQYKIGLYLMEKQLFEEARDEFEKVINDYPESEWAKAAKYQIAMVDAKRSTGPQYDQKITNAAVEEFKKFTENYPDADLTPEAKAQVQELRNKEAHNNFVIAQFYEKKKNFKSAKIYYQSIVDDYATSTWAPKALKRIQELSQKNL